MMMKRIIPLLFVVGILTAIAPAAMANHCEGCRIRPIINEPAEPECVIRTNYGFAYCEPDYYNGNCILTDPCGSHTAAALSLAAEYTVASVERLDEPQTAAAETLVASLEPHTSTQR